MTNRVNRRIVGTARWAPQALAVAWRLRVVIGLAVAYLVLLGWLFAGGGGGEVLRPDEALSLPANPVWEAPDARHWLGTTGNGTDLFALSRVAMARSVVLAVVASGLGTGLALLLVMLFALDPGEGRFRLIERMGAGGFLFPPMAGLVVVAGGAGGSLVAVMVALVVTIGFAMAPTVAGWFCEGETGNDALAGYALGLTRLELVRHRLLPRVVRRLVGMFARLIPVVTLVELGLSFLGLTRDRLSCGTLVAHGRQLILEAPWVAIGPGVMAAAVVAALALLGWLVAGATRTGGLPRFF